MWVGDEAHIGHVVRVLWDAVFKAKRHDVESDDDGPGFGEQFRGFGGQIVDVEIGGVQDHFGLLAQLRHEVTFSGDPIEN
ncbi:hypothetical protein QT22_00485 [Staphylococcus aureus]|nr:hypothetical protein QT22_00485 [Staphylococcus aureus]